MLVHASRPASAPSRRAAVAPSPSPRPGQPLPGPVRLHFERAFGASFADVRIHPEPAMPRGPLHAATRGSDIHISPSRYRPGTRAGDELLGHELAHVLQQRSGHARRRGVDPVNADPALERQAHEQGVAAARGEPVAVPGAAVRPRVMAAAPVQAGMFDLLGSANPRLYLPTALGGHSAEHLEERRAEGRTGAFDLLGPANPRQYLPTALGGYSEATMAERRVQRAHLPVSTRRRLLDAHRIVAPDAARTRPDEVSPAEHADALSVLEDVHLGRGALTVSPELNGQYDSDDQAARVRQQLHEDTLGDLAEISRTTQGRGLLRGLSRDDALPRNPENRRIPNAVSIRPYDTTMSPDAAPTFQRIPLDQRQGAYAQYTPQRVRDAEPLRRAVFEDQARYNPWALPHRADVGLFHELVHTRHIQRGEFLPKDDVVTGATDQADALDVQSGVPREEYRTVGIGAEADPAYSDNRYRAERRRLGENVPDRAYYVAKNGHGGRWVG